MPAEEDQ